MKRKTATTPRNGSCVQQLHHSMIRINLLIFLFLLTLAACEDDKNKDCRQENFENNFAPRNFKMGFTTWPYAPDVAAGESTYNFVRDNADIYAEHIDGKIPWKAWINNTPLPLEFENQIQFKSQKRISGRPMLLSVSILGSNRNELSEDFDGTIPDYQSMNDVHIREAYLKHVRYLVDEFSPEYLVFAIEVNELYVNNRPLWEGYKSMAEFVRGQLKVAYPNLKIAESLTLHSWLQADINGETAHVEEMKNYAMLSDFTAISFYAFMKGFHTKNEFQQAFDFLHAQSAKPIAIVETNHIAETLIVEAYQLSLPSDECEQNLYLETLLQNAQKQDYEFVIWWAHRDYDALWETFPDNVKDLGKLWRDTGLLDENGKERKAYLTWKSVLQK